MTQFVGILAIEGKPTIDGRCIAPGAITWNRRLPAPIKDVAHRVAILTPGHAVASIDWVERTADGITCKGSWFGPVPLIGVLPIAVHLLQGASRVLGDWSTFDGDQSPMLWLDSAELLGAHVTERSAWPGATYIQPL